MPHSFLPPQVTNFHSGNDFGFHSKTLPVPLPSPDSPILFIRPVVFRTVVSRDGGGAAVQDTADRMKEGPAASAATTAPPAIAAPAVKSIARPRSQATFMPVPSPALPSSPSLLPASESGAIEIQISAPMAQ